ncbi:hypothetical protein AEA09_07235 [Lysinibacillus contaminans]|uniref:Uncharacterized protein n=1 Tax=Lysinibacillus contaminans TaxID=1293441 RepID=A0ABR5K1X2_9BACI|nr:hypothetical protein [Lysinibacillus contaminans]KOS68369.1 hypothetical protein AEA09_07235 [Lysinibacillus contaminans]
MGMSEESVLILLSLVLLIGLTLRWIRIIKVNSNIQVEQNKEIIELLKKNSRDKDEIKINE